jgi:exopolysaccharide biosynthesis predicted pyruvyltransferase EpsI
VRSPTKSHPDDDIVRRLAGTTIDWLRSVDDGRRYALVDFPEYSNVGDSLIWSGARHALKLATGREPAYLSGIGNHIDREMLGKIRGGTIYITGGGNFGDLWPRHQGFRERLASSCLGSRIVQLPQSVWFSDEGTAINAAETFRRHGQFVLAVRDRESLARAQNLGAMATVLLPDMAFCARVPRPTLPPTTSTVGLLRSDQERGPASLDNFHVTGLRVDDWTTLDFEDLELRVLTRSLGRPRLWRTLPIGLQRLLLDRIAARRIAGGVRILSKGQRVVTDRLHGHLLALRLGMPHDILDNSYGKIRAHVDAWTPEAVSIRGRSWER